MNYVKTADIAMKKAGTIGTADRFDSPTRVVETPGPVYTLPSTFVAVESRPPVHTTRTRKSSSILTHPSRDRTSWIGGHIQRNSLATVGQISAPMGPAAYNPTTIIYPNAPRAAVGQAERWVDHKEMDGIDGPKYTPEVGNIDLRHSKSPSFSFGPKGYAISPEIANSKHVRAPSTSENSIHSTETRAGFVEGTVIDGLIYNARPSTSDPSARVPHAYNVTDKTLRRPPTAVLGREDRFKFTYKNGVSPGPIYAPSYYSIGESKTFKPLFVTTPAGQWRP
jgi:hypothetical protein